MSKCIVINIHICLCDYLYLSCKIVGVSNGIYQKVWFHSITPVAPLTILREKSLAIYFEGSQFSRNRTFNFIVQKIYVDKRSEYDDINRLTFHIM